MRTISVLMTWSRRELAREVIGLGALSLDPIESALAGTESVSGNAGTGTRTCCACGANASGTRGAIVDVGINIHEGPFLAEERGRQVAGRFSLEQLGSSGSVLASAPERPAALVQHPASGATPSSLG